VTIPELCNACVEALLAGQRITLSMPDGLRWPHGFPRGELLSVGSNGMRNVSHDPLRVLAWVKHKTLAMQALYGHFEATDQTQVTVHFQVRDNARVSGPQQAAPK